MPLANLIRDTAQAVVESLGLEPQDALVGGLATRWQKGTLFMQPADSSLQPKEVPLETAPWLEDPDEPDRMTEAEMDRMVEGIAKRFPELVKNKDQKAKK